MPRNKQKYTQHDFIECNCCRKRITREWLNKHYENYADGKHGICAHKIQSKTHLIIKNGAIDWSNVNIFQWDLQTSTIEHKSWDVKQLVDSINIYKNVGVDSMEVIMSHWNGNDALKTFDIPTEDVKQEYMFIKVKLLIIIANGSFDKIHKKLIKHFNLKKRMKYKWKERNTFLWIIFEIKQFNNGLFRVIFVIEYLESMGCPEPNLESVFSVLKLILNQKYNMNVDSLNDIFLIRYYLKDEFSDDTMQWLKDIAIEYLNGPHRSPVTGSRSKYGFEGEVFTKLLQKANSKVDLNDLVEDLQIMEKMLTIESLIEGNIDNDNDNDVIMQNGIVTLGLDRINEMETSSDNDYHSGDEKDDLLSSTEL